MTETGTAGAPRSRWKRKLLAVGVAALVAGCSGGDDSDGAPESRAPLTAPRPPASTEPVDAPSETSTAPVETVVESTTEPATTAVTTTAAPTTAPAPTTQPPTTAPAPSGGFAAVWRSEQDPDRINLTEGQPTHTDGPLAISIDMFYVLPISHEICQSTLEWTFEPPADPQTCLGVQFRFNVDESATDTASVSGSDAVTADGRQTEVADSGYTDARPNTVDNVGVAVFFDVGPGGRVFLNYSAQTADDYFFGDWEVVVPDLQPIDWL